MATLKCKMCGGDLELTPAVTVAECPYCGTKQTVPNADNDKKMTLFSRANRLRFNNEFDKAAGVYETIIGEFPKEAEAYWGLVLCKYGIEYVDDPATGKKIPTCHRSSFDSVMEDENLELAMEYADAVAKRMYREEAKQIEEIRKGILEVSSKEEPYDVFICYKETDESGERTLDSVLAQDIYNELTEKGYRVFFSRITLEDKLGQEYEPYIFAALHSARVMLAVGTSYEHYDAVWVKNEWSRYLQLMAAGEKKALIPCYKDLNAYDMPKEFSRLQAQDLGKIGAMQDLVRGVEKILGKKREQKILDSESAMVSDMTELNVQPEDLLKLGKTALSNGEFYEAKKFFKQVLKRDAECGQAYFGVAMADRRSKNVEEMIDSKIERLHDLIYSSFGEEKVLLKPNINLLDIARKTDAKTGLLTEFTDQELEKLLKDELNLKSEYYTSYQSGYKKELKNYDSIEKMVDGDGITEYLSEALEYADSEVRQSLEAIRVGMVDRLKRKIEEEKQIPVQWKEKMSIEIKETISGWLQEAAGNIAGQKAEAEAAQKEAEEKAEADYEKHLAEWKQAKVVYQAQCDTAVAEQLELQRKIALLEQEKAQLKGFFTGKKRKELEANITVFRNRLALIELPQDPGEAPNREEFYKDIRKQENQGKFQTAMAIFPSIREAWQEKEELTRSAVGEKVYFGKYPYDKDGGIQKIQWRVLDKKEDSLLLLTEYGIDNKQYNELQTDFGWASCSLRRWLNDEFLNEVFSAYEKKLIQPINLNSGVYYFNEHRMVSHTKDQVFLLHSKDLEAYFSDDNSRICFPTEYAQSQGAYIDEDTGGTTWWLRWAGYKNYDGRYVFGDGSRSNFAGGRHCVRPALWINLKSDIF